VRLQLYVVLSSQSPIGGLGQAEKREKGSDVGQMSLRARTVSLLSLFFGVGRVGGEAP